MAPTPSQAHQETVSTLDAELRGALKRDGGGAGGSACRLFVAPIDVVLSADSVVQPDIVAVCDPAKLADPRFVQGAPDLVIEVLSPSTAAKDMKQKRALYQRFVVAEYLLVHPTDHIAYHYRLDGEGRCGEPTIWSAEDKLRLALRPQFTPSFREWRSGHRSRAGW